MMQVPPEVSYRDVEKTEATEQLIRGKIAKLEQLHPDIVSCRVSVEKPQTFQESGSPYSFL
jgi:ribosome-associated translation inhibitor RaiA